MVDVEVQTLIRRPRDEVAAYAGNPDNATAWYANISAVRWETPAPVSLGSRFTFTAQFLGRELTYTYEVTELVAGRRFVMRTAQGPFPMETTYTWQDGPDGATLMTLRNRGEPAGFFRIASPLLAMAMKRANNADLAKLKSLLETS
ncbi:MAG: SRPBCC family protein [Mycobacterium sp.]|nr:SRPBCC family protein [Mycobacterium sp.]